jgi:hypothetical protein
MLHRCMYSSAVVVSFLAVPLWASETITEIPAAVIADRDIAPGLRTIPVAAVRASSTFAPESGQYAPAHAVDGDRSTKWVASVAPTAEAPQWIAMDLVGPQEVCAVAVFGERIDNDGILEARVDVATAPDKDFTTVATIPDARTNRWLVRFDPVMAASIRLSILRSGGPSPHTDVHEIVVLGGPLSAAELLDFARNRLAGCAAQKQRLDELTDRLAGGTASSLTGLAAAAAATEQRRQHLAAQLARWDAIDAQAQQALSEECQRLEIRAQHLFPAVERAADLWPERFRELAAARQADAAASLTAAPTASRADGKLRLRSRRVSVIADESDGTWDATWPGKVDAAVRRITCAVETGDQMIIPAEIRTDVSAVSDALGDGQEIIQRWGTTVEVERRLRVGNDKPAVIVSGRIVNHTDRDVTIRTVHLVQLSADDHGWWHLADPLQTPAAVGFPGASPPCRPAADEGDANASSHHFGSNGVLTLTSPTSRIALTVGFLSAHEGTPQVDARFTPGEGGAALGAALACGGKTLGPGQAMTVDPVWLSGDENGLDALERYGDAVAVEAREPVRTGANALWCSWYPIRMGISEDITLAHAAIAAEHFKPLGLDTIQLDHGWQLGDICGDWEPNERFPHGMKWLAEQLRTRYGMKLGLWIAPTQVAFTSRLFQEHPDWMRQNADGRPASVGRWYWVPNPEMAVLNAAHPAAEKWIEETFARLSASGASYYKIDFIAGSPALERAMAAIRRGAGPHAWVRYCQTPPLLSAGLASSAYIGDDTGDAGLAEWFDLERRNAPLLAASYWANDRLYHREVCDMSVGMKADVEEARFRLTLMTLSGCSISFSDDFRPLELPRIRMMQQCLPPGNPMARPLDLFDRQFPSLWHMRCENPSGRWDAVGMFNFDDTPQQRTVDLAALGWPADGQVVAFEFWEEKYLGTQTGQVALTLAPHTARIILIRRRPDHPHLIATNMHVLGGFHEVKRLAWDETRLLLAGQYQRAPGLAGKAYLYVPDGYRPLSQSPTTRGSASLTEVAPNLWAQEVQFQEASCDWTIAFERTTANSTK